MAVPYYQVKMMEVSQASWTVGSQGQVFDVCWPEFVLAPEPFALTLIEYQKVARERSALVCPLAMVVALVRFDWLSVYTKMSYAFIYSLCSSLLMPQPCRDVVQYVQFSPSWLYPGNSGTWHASRLSPAELDRGRKRSTWRKPPANSTCDYEPVRTREGQRCQ